MRASKVRQNCTSLSVRPNRKISVFRLTGLKILGMVGTHIFFLEKKNILCILKCISPFKMHKIIFFSRNLKKFQVSSVNLGRVRLT